MEDYIIIIFACLMALVCGMIIGYMLTSFSNSYKLPKNMKIGPNKYPNINLNDPALVETVYNYSDTKEYDSADLSKSAYKKIVLNCRKCNIFFGDTRVTKLNDLVKKNDLIAITALISAGMYATSYERIATLYENQDQTYFEMCIAACAENIIDGYYSVIVMRNGRQVTIAYEKVQSPNTKFLHLVPKKDYDAMNTKSAKDTVTGLFGL